MIKLPTVVAKRQLSLEELADAFTAYKLQSYCNTRRRDRNGTPIEMRFTFEEWLQFWLDSGHWDERGAKKGQYCMARINDLGHYEKGNVEIKLSSANAGEATSRSNKGRELSEEHKAALSAAGMGRQFSDEHRANISAAKLGVPRDEATKAKLSAANKGKGWSEARRAAHAARLAAGKKAQGWSPEQRAKYEAKIAARKQTE